MNFGNKRFVIISSVIAISLVVILIGNRTSKTGTTGGEYVAPDTPAFLVYKKDSYLPFKTNFANNALREDVAYYARKKFKEYNPSVHPSVTFTLTKDPVTAKDKLSIIGKYEKVKNVIKIGITELRNSRLKVTISDEKSDTNIDSELPSNTARNQYIGKLPENKGSYVVDYSLDTDKFIVTLNDDDQSIVAIAKTYINTQTKTTEDVGIIIPTSVGDGSPVGL